MNKILKNFRVLTLLAALFLAGTALAQDRQQLRNAIQQWGQCRTVALSNSKGSVVINEDNAYSAAEVPNELNDALIECHNNGQYIKEVHITDGGRWLILADGNGYITNNVPAEMDRMLKSYNQNGETLISATCNDQGDWTIVTDQHFTSSDTQVQQWLKEGNSQYGGILNVCYTDEVKIAIFENGYSCTGNIPASLDKALDETELDIHVLKVAGNSWFMADGEGNYSYSM